MKRKISLLITIVAVLLSMITNVSAAAPSTVKFNYRSLSGVNAQTGATTYYKTVTSGNATIISYCLQRSLKIPTSGSTVTYKSSITDAGMIYIYSNGYGGTWNTSLLGSGLTNDQRYYATQMALWMYQGQLATTNLNTNDAAVIAAIKLSNAAKSAKTTNPSISVNRSTANMTYDGTYYKSKVMTVTGSDFLNYTVTLINAGSYAEIVTTSGKVYSSGITLPAGTQFYVRVADSKVSYDMNMTVKVTATAKVTNIYRYTNGDSTYQDIGIMMASTTSVTDSTTIKLVKEIKPSTINITKRDSSTLKPLSGATLVLKDSKGIVVDKWISTAGAHTVKNLEPGTYYVSELVAPTGYTLNSKVVSVAVAAGESKSVIFDNTPKEIPKYNVNIVKVDSSTGKNLSGATLVLKDSNGNPIDTWVSTTSSHTVKDLTQGVYTVTEIKAPTGYVLNSTPVKFTVIEGGDTNKTVTIYNTKEDTKTYSVKVSKQDITTKKELPGAKLTLKNANGSVVATWVSTSTPHYVTGLTPGKYTLIETKSPSGYGLSDEIIEFTIDTNGKVDKEVIMYNSPIPVTADRNLVIIFIGFAGFIALGGFGMFKLSKQK